MLFRNATEIPIGQKANIKVKCISKPNTKTKLTIDKIYFVNELSILDSKSCRVKCDTGRNVWYNKIHFKECK